MKHNVSDRSLYQRGSSNLSLSSYTNQDSSLNYKESRKLARIETKISKFLLTMREKKIMLMQKLDQSLTENITMKEQIAKLQRIQINKIKLEKDRKENILLVELQKREVASAKLQEALEAYQQKAGKQVSREDFNKAQKFVQMLRHNYRLQQQINYDMQKQLSYKYQISSNKLEELQKEVQMLLKMKKQMKNSLQQEQSDKNIFPKQLTPKQMEQITSNFSEPNRLIAQQLIDQIRWKRQSTNQLQQYIEQQQAEKGELFGEVLRLKEKLQELERENGYMRELVDKQ